MEFIYFFGFLTLLFTFIFYYLKTRKPQTIWLGITFLGVLINFMIVIGVLLVQQNLRIPLTILAVLFVVLASLFPTLMIGTFLMNEVKLIRNEGFKFRNLLSLTLCVGLILYLFLWPYLVDVTQSHILNTVYQFISFSAFYLSMILILYTVTNFLNLIHLKDQQVDYFIVLGAGL